MRAWTTLLCALLLTAASVAPAVGQSPLLAQAPDEPADERGEGDFGDTFVPSFDDEADDDETDDGEADDDDEAEDDEGFGDTFAPSFDDETDEGFGDTFAPSFDDETEGEETDEGFGDTFAPSFDDETDEGETQGDEGEDLDLDDELADDEDEWTEEDEYYEQFWEQFEEDEEEQETVEELVPPDQLEQGLGRVEGIIIDEEFDQPLYDVVVTLDEAPDVSFRTGDDGRFYFDLGEGFWVIRFQAVGFTPQAYEIEVIAGETTEMGEIIMGVDQDTVATIVVEGRADRQSEETQLRRRQEATVAQDAISAEEISRRGDSTAQSAVRRVVSATIVDGQFLFVRGLGGRYSQVILNGVEVPGTDPDYPGVELSLFPAGLLANLTISKAFSPADPGNWAGGLLEIATRDYPEEFEASVSVSTTATTGTTFGDLLTYNGGDLDLLGFDDGTRALPDSVPGDRAVEPRPEFDDVARSFENVWSVRDRMAVPDLSLSATVGDTIELGGDANLGYLATLGYSHSEEVEDGLVRNVRLENDPETGEQVVGIRQTLDQTIGTERARWSGLGTLTLGWNPDNDLSLVVLWSKQARDRVRFLEGFDEGQGAPVEQWQLRWVERNLVFGQLLGRHRHLFWDSEVEWQVSGAVANRAEPDTRDITYQFNEQLGDFQLSLDPGSATRFFSELQQQDASAGLDWTIPPSLDLEIKLGGLGRLTNRDFESRRFRYVFLPTADPSLRSADPEVVLGPDQVGQAIRIRETTRPEDSYEADQVLAAGYLMVDWRALEQLRFVAGARYEHFSQDIAAVSPFGTDEDLPQNSRSDDDVLPAAGIIYQPTEEMFVRLNYGGTVARPQLREVAPFLFQDFVRRRTVRGNPDLERTFIHNVDLRWEWFLSPTELIAATVFFKRFIDPIETTVFNATQGDLGYVNLDSANNFGGEVEFRLNLGRFSESLEAWSLNANLTLVSSSVELSDEQRGNATSTERRLEGQSDFVANASIGFAPEDTGLEAYLNYNVFGRRIEEVGIAGLPDRFLEPFHSLDFVLRWGFVEHWALSFQARNLAHQSERLTQGDITVEEVQPGTSFSLGLKWSY